MKYNGFTLVELLVTVSIISILSTIGLVVYQSVSENARDAKRVSDLKVIQGAIEQYHGDQLNYPATSALVFGSSLTVGSKIYLNMIPKDPLDPTQTYCYKALPDSPLCDNSSPTTKCTGYEIYAKLENPPSLSPTYTCSGVSTYNYQVTPP